jgi:hypothetical protein
MMVTRRICSYVCAVAGLILIAAQTAAQPADKRTFFTFSAPVELPGVALPPGKYLFRVVDPEDGGNVVQVLSDDGTKVYSTCFSIPAYRLESPDQPEVRFIETPPGVPPAIKAWWYPGDSIGREFIYPRTQALRLARTASEPVLTTRGASTTTDQTNIADLTRVSANGQETKVDTANKPAAAEPRGKAQKGDGAPSSLVIASHSSK